MKVCDELVISNCGVPSGKLRKEIKTKVAWQEDMWDPASDSFYQVKTMVEEKVIKNCDGIIQGVSFTSFFICDKVLGFRGTDEIVKEFVQKLDHTLKNGFCKQLLLYQ